MKLYQEIIFLEHFFKGKYCVENVIPYYQPLITAKKRGRHLYWTNFNLPNDLGERKAKGFTHETNGFIKRLSDFHNYDFRKYKGKQRIHKIARNLVDYEAGKTIFDVARETYKNTNTNQESLF